MELSYSNIKKFLIYSFISGNLEQILHISWNGYPKKASFGKWNFSAHARKNFFYFLERKLFLHFGKQKPWNNSLYSKKRNFLISRETLKKTSYISGSNFLCSKNAKHPLWKNFSYFWRKNFLYSSTTGDSVYWERTFQTKAWNKFFILICSCFKFKLYEQLPVFLVLIGCEKVLELITDFFMKNRNKRSEIFRAFISFLRLRWGGK